MRWNYEVRLDDAIVVEGFTDSELEANKTAIVWIVRTVLEYWPDAAPTSRVWR